MSKSILPYSGMVIGKEVKLSTEGSILFAGTDRLLSEDNNNLFWNNTDKSLVLQQANTPLSPALSFGDGQDGLFSHIDGGLSLALDGVSNYEFDSSYFKSTATSAFSIAKADSGETLPTYGFNGDANTGLGRSGADSLYLMAGGNVGVRLNASGEVEINSSYTLPIADGTVGQVLATDGAGGLTFAGASSLPTGFTEGSVLFAGVGGVMEQDNASFHWDLVNKRLGIGTPNSITSTDFVGGNARSIVTKTTTYTATINDSTILCDSTAGSFTVTLPTAASAYNSDGTGLILKIKRVSSDSSGNLITIDGNGTETIDNQLTQTLASGASITIQSDGTSWHIISN